jgi:ankyrin repeat protein
LLAYNHTRKPIETAWDVVLSKALPSSEADRLASLFNDSSFLESRRFSPIHKIVLGLSQHPLEPELTQASPAQVNLVDAQGRTALAWAAARHDTEAVKLLLDAGADPRALDFEGCSPLFNAVRAMDCEAAQLLLSYGADVHQRDVYGATALHVACEKNDCPEMVEVLAAAGLNVNSIDLGGDPPLHYAIWEDRADTVRTLLDLGADPSIANVAGDNAVFMALYHGASRSFGILLERGAPVDMTTTSGQTILHVAAMLPKLDILSRLATVDLGKIDPDLIDANGKRYEDYLRESIDISDERMLAAARSFMNVVNQAKAAKGVEGPFPIPLATGSRNQAVGVKETQSDESEDEEDFVDALETLSI